MSDIRYPKVEPALLLIFRAIRYRICLFFYSDMIFFRINIDAFFDLPRAKIKGGYIWEKYEIFQIKPCFFLFYVVYLLPEKRITFQWQPNHKP